MASKSKSKSALRRKNVGKTSSVVDPDSFMDTPVENDFSQEMVGEKNTKPQFFKIAVVVLIVAALAAVLFRNRGWFVAATVNGTPIPRWELNDRLTKRFGDQVLEAIIGEKLITDAAAKAGVSASNEEIGAKVNEIEQSLSGSMKLDDALQLQGVTREEFESQVRVQILIDKMMSKEVSVSAQEIDEYVKGATAAGQTLSASEAAQQREAAEKELKANKVAEKFQEWFAKLKEEAKVQKYL